MVTLKADQIEMGLLYSQMLLIASRTALKTKGVGELEAALKQKMRFSPFILRKSMSNF